MQVYNDFSKEKIDKNTFINVLELIQVFVWRRFIIGLPTNALNKIFMRLYEDVDTSSYLPSIQKTLVKKRGAQRFPRDLEVLTTLKEKDVYGIKPKNRTYFLERLENHNNSEKVIIEGSQDITIEHIFPQNPDAKWKATLGTDEYNYIKENMLNTIGNLTLSGNNGKLGNKYFIQKRDMNIQGKEQGYKYSRLWLNKHLAGLEKWGKKEIENRYNLISERFKAVWPFPNIELDDDDADFNEINIFDAEEPKGKKLSYAILFDQKLELTKISDLYRETMKLLFDLQPQIFFTSELGEKVSITKNSSKLRQPMSIDEIYHIEAKLDSNGKFERIKLALSVYDCEDELLIKYADD